MQRASVFISAALLFGLVNGYSFGQDWARTWIGQLHRVDLRNLGFPEVNEIPENSSAITSLMTASDGKIYGATSGENAYLFLFDPRTNKVRHLGRLEGERGVHHSLVEDSRGNLYIGTGLNPFEDFVISEGGYWESIDKALWNDIKSHFSSYPGGHLYRYRPAESNEKVKLVNMDAELEDLGIPVANNSIYALAGDLQGENIYGLTYPDGHFFRYFIASGAFEDLGPIDEEIVFHGPERNWRTLPRALVVDQRERVFTSSTDGELKYYDPETSEIEGTGLKIPGDYYPAQFYTDYAAVEYFAKDSSGLIYGGTSDGYLFRLDPQKMDLVNLGKPRAERRLRCLALGPQGDIYLVAGERPATSSVPCKFYRYDPKRGGFEDLGLIIVDRSPHYYRRGYQFDSMTAGSDGTIYIGESERDSSLFLFVPPFRDELPQEIQDE